MSNDRKCLFYRNPEKLALGRSNGNCELNGRKVICDGDTKVCENPDALSRPLLSKESNGGPGNKGEGNNPDKKPSSCKVLVVDDELPLRELIVTLLSQQGHQCRTACNGIEALSQMSQNYFDAVITDIVMPEMDGIVLTKRILSLHPHLPVMVMTGYSERYSAESAIQAGAREFIKKPFSIDELIIRLNKMIRDHSIGRQTAGGRNEPVFHLHRECSEEITGLKKEMESLRSKLRSLRSGLGL